MSTQTQTVTVWHFLSEYSSEDGASDGISSYSCRLYDAMLARRTEQNGQNGIGRISCTYLDGFLFCPPDMETGLEDSVFGASPLLSPGCDYIASGDASGFGTPWDASSAGIPVFCITSVTQPPRISDGTLVDWICISAQRDFGGHTA